MNRRAIVDFGDNEKEYGNMYPFKQGEMVLLLDECEGMEGHYPVVTPDGKTHFAYHDDFFKFIDIETKERCEKADEEIFHGRTINEFFLDEAYEDEENCDDECEVIRYSFETTLTNEEYNELSETDAFDDVYQGASGVLDVSGSGYELTNGKMFWQNGFTSYEIKPELYPELLKKFRKVVRDYERKLGCPYGE